MQRGSVPYLLEIPPLLKLLQLSIHTVFFAFDIIPYKDAAICEKHGAVHFWLGLLVLTLCGLHNERQSGHNHYIAI